MNRQEKINKTWRLKKEGNFAEVLKLYKKIHDELVGEAGYKLIYISIDK